METLTGKALVRGGSAVDLIPQQGMAQACQVDPDLMGAARLQAAADVGIAPVAGQDLPVGHGGTAAGEDGHALAVCGMAADGL